MFEAAMRRLLSNAKKVPAILAGGPGELVVAAALRHGYAALWREWDAERHEDDTEMAPSEKTP
jgi:hypothetical protein